MTTDIAIIVPVKGACDSLKTNLLSLLAQRPGCSRLICVTDSEQDPAVQIIRDLQQLDERVVHVVAGSASRCCQKNYNLLAGYRAAANRAQVLVFCDAGHSAPENWLANLTAPLLSDNSSSVVCSGYHNLIPDRSRPSLVLTCRALTVLALQQVRRIPPAAQPWGGSTALRTEDFKRLGIYNRWSETVVDDVVLADLLQQHGIPLTIAWKANLETRTTDRSFQAWSDWLIRQWAYLKAVFPLSWLFLGLSGITLTFLHLASIAAVLLCWTDILPEPITLAAAGTVSFFILFSLLLYWQHPSPGPIRLWYPALIGAMLMAGWCHIKLWRNNTIHWAGITYTYGPGGKVTDMVRQDNKDGNKP